MKENQRIILIIGVSLALLELLCPPTTLGLRSFIGLAPVLNTNPDIDISTMIKHLAVIGLATLLAYLICASTTIGRWWAKVWDEICYDPTKQPPS